MYQPLAVVKKVLKAFSPVADPWLLAAWFRFPNGWLAGADGRPLAPKDALDRRDALIPPRRGAAAATSHERRRRRRRGRPRRSGCAG